ncbi:hypothetical protein VTN00DRAFT_2750 [Thermoascus crustaceus]|uniref:uncharacterized protein n=1 Tax=Thermoascus crustaceus TaxID=5088 RepID=UPI003742142B
MGNKLSYCERRCQICTVSFRVKRVPTPEEEDAWHARDAAALQALQRNDGAGYDGSVISTEEMKGINTLRCLLQKPADFVPEEGDEDFERDSSCFLTDFAVHQGPYIYDSGTFNTVRHGVSEAKITNDNGNFGGEWGMPFHPACFEIFKRVCLRKLGFVDIDGLWRVRDLRGLFEYSMGCGFPPLSVRQYAFDDEKWHHKPGTEYLAANPVDIPGFQELLNHLSDSEDTSKEPNHQAPSPGAPSHSQSHSALTTSGTDIFSTLPPELLTEILWSLSARDIANLRLASRSFRTLPPILFKHLIRTEMPYFWEIDGLDPRGTDWADLYKMLQHNWSSGLLGLRNRVRIWHEAEKIVEMIQETNHGLTH